MAALEGTVLADNSGSNFQLWTTFIHNQITGSGFTYLPITGDIDLTTATASANVNTKTGFKLYAFNDALQATTPIYFRLDFGTGAAALRPSIWITAGFSYTATGSIRHTSSIGDPDVSGANVSYISEYQIPCGGNSTTPGSHSWSGDGSYLTAALWYTITTTGKNLLSLERTKDATGSPDGRGIIGVFGGPNVRRAAIVYFDSASLSMIAPTWSTIVGTRNPAIATGSYGTIVPISAVILVSGQSNEISTNLIALAANEFSQYKDLFVNIRSLTIPFRIYDTAFRTAGDFTNGTNMALGLRFHD